MLWRASLLSPFQFALCAEEGYFLCLMIEMRHMLESANLYSNINRGEVQEGISSLRVYCREQEWNIRAYAFQGQ